MLFRILRHPALYQSFRKATVAMLLTTVMLGLANQANAGGRPPKQRRLTLGSYAEYQIVPTKNGQTKIRTNYNGQADFLPRPGIFYYGYPHEELSYGPGIF